MDEEDIERDYLKDQMYLWEKEYEAQDELFRELESDKIKARKPAIIKVVIEQPKTKEEEV